MDDQQENVFDVTARARQRRRSRPPAPSGKEAEGPRSDAPKSIAGSLLVPAEMLAGSLPAGQAAAENGQAALPRGTTAAVDGMSAGERAHQNPFLGPQAERAAPASKPDRWRVVTAVLARPGAWTRIHPGSAASSGPRTIARHLAGAPRLRRGFALAAFTAAIAITVVIASQSGTRHRVSERSVRAAGLLGAPRTDALSAASNPLGQRAAPRERARHQVRRVHARRITRAHRRSHPATKPVKVAVRYTPSASATGSYAPSSTSSSYAGSSSTPVPSQPAPSTGGATTSSSSSGSSRPAFGENGILGPGRGAPGTQ